MSEHEVFLHAAIALEIITRQQAQKYFLGFQQTNENFFEWIQSRGLSSEQVLQIKQYVKMHQTHVQPQTNKMEHSFFVETHDSECFQETMEIETQQLNFAPGMQFNHYTIQKELGQGGMGIVYQALDKKLQRVVALKVIKGKIKLNDQQLERFASEARAVAKINHSSIVKIFEIGDSPEHYLAMEYVPGKTLKESLKNKKWTPKVIARFIRRCALALDFVHNKNIIHRDLKPSNIMLDQAHNPKIADFGLAKEIDRKKSASSGFVGTPSYASPEQVGGAKNISSATDIYSLGAVLYELLTKRPPFQGESILNIFFQILNRDLVAPRTLNPDIPKELEAICLKSMSKSPKSRYRNMREFARDLQNYVEDKPVIAKPPSYFEKMAKFVKRNKIISSLVFATFLACLAVIIYLLEVIELKEDMLVLEENISTLQIKEQKLKEEGQKLKKEGQKLKKEEKKLRSSIIRQKKEIIEQKYELEKKKGELKEEKSNFYQREINSLYNSIERGGNSEDVKTRLQKIQSPENWEWRWLYHQKDRSLYSFFSSIENAFYSHFEKNGVVKSFFSHRSFLWNSKNDFKKEINVTYNEKPIRDVQLSFDKKIYAYLGYEEFIVLENRLTKKRVAIQLPEKQTIKNIRFREDNKKIVAWGLGTIYIIDCIQKEIEFTIDITGLGVHHRRTCQFIGENSLVFCSKTRIYKVNLDKINKKKLNITEALRNKKSIVSIMNFSYISSIENLICTSKFWIIAGRNSLYIYYPKNKSLLPFQANNRFEIRGITLSSDKKYLVSWGNNNIRLWSILGQKHIESFFGHIFRITACNFSKDNKHLFSHDLHGNVKVWRLGTEHTLNYRDISILRSKTIDNLLINVGIGKISIWDLPKKKLLGKSFTFLEYKSVDAIKLSPKRYLIIAGHLANNGLSVFLWNGKELLLQKFHNNIHRKLHKNGRSPKRTDNNIQSCLFIKYQGEQFLATTFINSIFLWDKRLWEDNNASPRAIFTFGKNTLRKKHISQIAYDKNLERFCAITSDNIYLWTPFSQKPTKIDKNIIRGQVPMSPYKTVTWFDKGKKIILGNGEGYLFLFNLQTLKIERFFEGHFGVVTACCLNKKATRLISSDVKGNVHFWDLTHNNFKISPLLKMKFSTLYSSHINAINQIIIVEEGPRSMIDHILFTSREATRILRAPFIKIKK